MSAREGAGRNPEEAVQAETALSKAKPPARPHAWRRMPPVPRASGTHPAEEAGSMTGTPAPPGAESLGTPGLQPPGHFSAASPASWSMPGAAGRPARRAAEGSWSPSGP